MGKKRCAGLLVPEEVLTEILVRLPVVSLLRFKSVSKSWGALIETSFFIHLHTTFNQLGDGGADTFILQASQGDRPGSKSDFLMFSCEEESAAAAAAAGYESDDDKKKKKKSDDDDDDDEDEDEVEVRGFKLDKLEPPNSIVKTDAYSPFTRITYMAGSCNGLICLRDPYYNDIFLWNPATRQSMILPKPSLTPEMDYNVFSDLVAFGFDVKTNDYKVLLITCFNPKYTATPGPRKCLCRVQIYSLSTNSWKLLLEGIDSLPGVPSGLSQERSSGIYMNGCYFFVGCKIYLESIFTENSLTVFHKTENSLIISFDFTREIFTTMQFPHDDDDDDVVQRRWYFSCLGGDKLALFAIRDYSKYEDCDIWLLNEQHGVGGGAVIKESWTKLHCFQIQRSGTRERTLPRGILNNGEFALLETIFYADEEKKKKEKEEKKKKMQLYNLVTKEAKTDFLVCSRVKTVEVYKPSLVSIIGGNGAAAAAATDTVIGGTIWL